MQLEWIPGHMNIKGNELADKAAKKGTKLQRTAIETEIAKISSNSESEQRHRKKKKKN